MLVRSIAITVAALGFGLAALSDAEARQRGGPSAVGTKSASGTKSAVGSQSNRAKSCHRFCDGAKGYLNLKLNKVTVTSRKTKRHLQDLPITKKMDKSTP
jgi:hypothetical protein